MELLPPASAESLELLDELIWERNYLPRETERITTQVDASHCIAKLKAKSAVPGPTTDEQVTRLMKLASELGYVAVLSENHTEGQWLPYNEFVIPSDRVEANKLKRTLQEKVQIQKQRVRIDRWNQQKADGFLFDQLVPVTP